MMESPAPMTSAPVSPDQRDGRHGAGGPGGRGVRPLAILVTETIYNSQSGKIFSGIITFLTKVYLADKLFQGFSNPQ